MLAPASAVGVSLEGSGWTSADQATKWPGVRRAGLRLSPALTPGQRRRRRRLDEVPPRYRALLLLATFANLRFGELAGLRRHHIDLDACVVRVSVSTAETDDGRLIDDGPKSRAGIRTVSFPREIVPELRWHLECFALAGDDGLVFIGPLGGRLRRKNFRKF